MKWNRRSRKFWVIGEQRLFRMSKQNCSKFLRALVICDGTIQETFSIDVRCSVPIADLRPSKCAVSFIISLPVGSEQTFEKYTWNGILEENPNILGDQPKFALD